MKRSIVGVAFLLVAWLPPGSSAAASAISEDDCSVAPTLAGELESGTDGRSARAEFVGDRGWFGQSVYLPDGTLVGPAADGTPRGEVPQFNDDILNTHNATWGVVVDTFPGARIYSPGGAYLFDLPISVHAEAVYKDGLILVADWGDVGSHLERVLLVKQDGTVTELTTAANGFGQFGTVLDDTVYVVMLDGGIATFDTDGNAGPVLAASTLFTGVTSRNGFLYATEGAPLGTESGATVVHVLASSAEEVATVDLGGSAVRMGATALGFAADVHGDSANRAVAMAPNGSGVTELDGLHDTVDPLDALAWEHGRYLIGIDAEAETPEGVTTGRIRLYRLDGAPLGSSETLEYRNWPAGRPAGKVLALVGASGQSVDLRSLSGVLLDHFDYSADTSTEVEAIDGNDDYIWVTTGNREDTRYTAHIYDLGGCAGRPDPGRFLDDDGSIFENDIEWLAAAAITRGCNPAETNTRFCPDDAVTRGQMAAFLVRALGLSDAGGGDLFSDDDGSLFEGDIDILGNAGITRGCDPPVNDRYCPDAPVTRGQMAAFLVRALGLSDAGGGDLFSDDDGSLFEGDIDILGNAGITRGCDPPVNDRYCPDAPVTRGQMAAFLVRALAG